MNALKRPSWRLRMRFHWNAAYYWLVNALLTRSHTVRTDLQVGDWHEPAERVLPAMFAILNDYVERSLAWEWYVWQQGDSTPVAERPVIPWVWRLPIMCHWWRNAEFGLAQLAWAATLKVDNSSEPTEQAKCASEVRDLYRWYKLRASRVDPYDLRPGETLTGEQSIAMLRELAAKLPEASLNADKFDMNILSQAVLYWTMRVESGYDLEDTAMLKRLIDIRGSMWT